MEVNYHPQRKASVKCLSLRGGLPHKHTPHPHNDYTHDSLCRQKHYKQKEDTSFIFSFNQKSQFTLAMVGIPPPPPLNICLYKEPRQGIPLSPKLSPMSNVATGDRAEREAVELLPKLEGWWTSSGQAGVTFRQHDQRVLNATTQLEMSTSTDLLVDNVQPDLQHLAPDKGVHVMDMVLDKNNKLNK